MNPGALTFIAAGTFTMLGAIFNWDFFMNSGKAKFWVKILTRNGARIFFGLLGLALFALGVAFWILDVDMSA